MFSAAFAECGAGALHWGQAAELMKYAENAFLAMKVTFIKRWPAWASSSARTWRRWCAASAGILVRGLEFLRHGHSGSRFAVDTLALVRIARDAASHVRRTAVNDQGKRTMAGKVITARGGNVRSNTIHIPDIAFKSSSDDIRDSPSSALEYGATVKTGESVGAKQARRHIDGIEFAANAHAGLDASAVVIVSEWKAFRSVDLACLGGGMAKPVLVDLRNIYRRGRHRRHGFSDVRVQCCQEAARTGARPRALMATFLRPRDALALAV